MQQGAAKAALPLLHLYLSQGQGWQALKVALLVLKRFTQRECFARYPAASTATSSAGKLTRRVVDVVVATWVIRCEKQLIRVECTSISLIAFCFQERIVQVASTGIEILKTPYHAPRANAICERYLRSVRQECLDHLLISSEKQLQRVLNEYVAYFNQARPHQGIEQQIPQRRRSVPSSQDAGNKVIALPVVGGLRRDYQWAA